MHRLIMLSRAYQLASADDADGRRAIDPANDYLWRFDRRRLDAEEIRDAHAGRQRRPRPHDARPAAPVPAAWRRGTTRSTSRSSPSTRRNHRSVYLMQQRIQKQPFLAMFDGADPNASTADRIEQHDAAPGAVPDERPVRLTSRARSSPPALPDRVPDAAARIELAIRRATAARAAADEDRRSAATFMRRLPSSSLTRRRRCRAGRPRRARRWRATSASLLCSNEFFYVD